MKPCKGSVGPKTMMEHIKISSKFKPRQNFNYYPIVRLQNVPFVSKQLLAENHSLSY